MEIETYIKKIENISISNNLLQKCDYLPCAVVDCLFSYLLFKKYKIDLPIDDFYYLFRFDFLELYGESYANEFAKFLIDSKNRIVCVYIHVGTNNSKHANLLIYRKNVNTIEYYEPNGEFSESYGKTIRNQTNYLMSLLKKLLPSFTYVPSWKLHGYEKFNDKIFINGLQTYECCKNQRGYCAIWCFLLKDLILKYDNISTQSIICKYLKLDEYRNKDKRFCRNYSRWLRCIIRGFYFTSINDLNKMEEFNHIDISLSTINKKYHNEEYFKTIIGIVSDLIYLKNSENIK